MFLVRYNFHCWGKGSDMKFVASQIDLSAIGGEYFQVLLNESEAEDCSYVLLQNSFEFSSGPAYFECHNLDLAGTGRLKRCKLGQASLEIDLKDSDGYITVIFNEPKEKIGNLAWMLRRILNKRVPFVNSSGIPEEPIIEDPDLDLDF